MKRRSESTSKPVKATNPAEFEAALRNFQNWAKEVGVTEADIDDAIKTARKNKKMA